jgi:hypothetical protein
MNNKSKEFEELLDNTLLKVHNQALGNRNPKWKEWWQRSKVHRGLDLKQYGVSFL